VQRALGFWADGRVYHEFHTAIDWRWMLMEMASLSVGAVLLWRYRLPFMVMPIAVTLWYTSMDLSPFLFGMADQGWEMRKHVSLWFGMAMLGLALWVDIRARQEKDYAFWLYLFGLAVVVLGIAWQRHEKGLSAKLRTLLPSSVQDMIKRRI
jgi:hypothetical protein